MSLSVFLIPTMGGCAEGFSLAGSIPLPGVHGRIDHLGMDPVGQRLFVAALGNDTVEVIDLKESKVIRSLSGFSEPQGICLCPGSNTVVVANGGSGRCQFFDATTLEPQAAVELREDADNARFDSQSKSVVVGYGSGALAFIDPQTKKVTQNIPLAGHPESFQIDALHSRIFANVPSAHSISVIDSRQGKVIGSLNLGLNTANFPMALEGGGQRLFVGCRMPARLLIFDCSSGKLIDCLSLHGDCDDLFYDGTRNQLYASCGQGYLDIFAQGEGGRFELKQSVSTVRGARTCFFYGSSIYLAVPQHGDEPAELRIYNLN